MNTGKRTKLASKVIGLTCIAAILATGTIAFGAAGSKDVQVIYNNIKLVIDGAPYTPKDSDGVVVEPFILNGTTYLPVRAVADAFGKDVAWDSQTATVSIGAKSADWLDQLGMYGYETTDNRNNFVAWGKGEQATDGIAYDRGLRFWLGYGEGDGAKKRNDGSLESWQTAEYLLDGKYQRLLGNLVCYNSKNEQNAVVNIYGDNQVLYTSPPLTGGTKSVNVDVDVKNVKVLKIRLSIPNPVEDWGGSTVGIVDARLTK